MSWKNHAAVAVVTLLPLVAAATSVRAEEGVSGKTVCFLYNDRSVQFWTDAAPLVFEEFRKQGVTISERVYNNDTNKQLEQTRDCITQKVDGIAIFPQDAQSAVTIIQEANAAAIPIGIFNRPPANKDNPAILTSADNYKIATDAMEFLTLQAKKAGRKITPFIMVGDLADQTAVERRRGFMDVVARYPDVYEAPVEVPTKWDAATGLANLQNALQANPDIGLLFTSSDFLYPQIQASLDGIGKWQKIGSPDHVITGGIDGTLEACQLMRDGYIDATGVQDMTGELRNSIDGVLKAAVAGEKAPNQSIVDPVFTLTQENLGSDHGKMWGCTILDSKKS